MTSRSGPGVAACTMLSITTCLRWCSGDPTILARWLLSMACCPTSAPLRTRFCRLQERPSSSLSRRRYTIPPQRTVLRVDHQGPCSGLINSYHLELWERYTSCPTKVLRAIEALPPLLLPVSRHHHAMAGGIGSCLRPPMETLSVNVQRWHVVSVP